MMIRKNQAIKQKMEINRLVVKDQQKTTHIKIAKTI